MPEITFPNWGYVIWIAALWVSLAGIAVGLTAIVIRRAQDAVVFRVGQSVLILGVVCLLGTEALAWAQGFRNDLVRFGMQLAVVASGVLALAGLLPRRSAQRSRVAAPALLALSVFSLCWMSFELEDSLDAQHGADVNREWNVGPLVDATDAQAWTDLGTPIALMTCDPPRRQQPPDYASEERFLRNPEFAHQVIMVGPPDSRSNCHGWTFTGGQFHLADEAVTAILQENGYARVEQPRPGDVIVYRSGESLLCHTGVVKAVGAHGFVLIESKWGCRGRYLHTPEKQCYSQQWEYYRSSRPGNLIVGLQAPSGAEIARPPTECMPFGDWEDMCE